MEITIEERRPKKQKSFWFTNRSLERKRIENPHPVSCGRVGMNTSRSLYCEQGNFQMIYV